MSASTSASAPCWAMYAALPRSAVSGVRSSCEASATKRRSASRARSSEASIALSVSESAPTSSRASAGGSRRVASPVSPIAPAAAERSVSGRSARRVSSERDSDCEHRRGDRGQQHERPQPVRGVLVLLRAGGDEHGAAGGRPGADARERRAVEPHRIVAEPGVASSGRARSRSRRRSRRACRARRPPSDAERATMRPRRSTTSTSSRLPPTRPSSAPGAVSSAGADALSWATCVAPARSAASRDEACSRSDSATAVMPSSTVASAIAAPAASATRTRRLAGFLMARARSRPRAPSG